MSADQLLRTFAITTPPVDVRSLAKRMGVVINDVPAYEFSGSVEQDDDAAIIKLRRSDAEVRKRFTIAHELGHLILHGDQKLWRDASFSGSAKEMQANGYAAALLVPLWMLTPYARSSQFDYDAEKLAGLFHVSKTMMQIRLLKWMGA